MPLSGSIHPVGVPRTPIPGADSAPVFRGEGAAPQAAGPAAVSGSAAAPESPASEIDALREATAAAAAERKAKAAERTARVRERERDLAQRENRIQQVEARLRAYQQPGGAALALRDLEDAGIPFEALAQVVANGGMATPDQDLAAVRAELEDLRNGVRQAEQTRAQREAAERSQAQRAAEADAKDGFLRDVAGAAQQDPGRWQLINHYGDRAVDVIWNRAEQAFQTTGAVPDAAQLLDAIEAELAEEIDGASAARAGRGFARSSPPGARPRAAGPTEADRRRAFLAQLDGILRRVR